ncbi:hypothetical protein [Limnochorda pilosa]|uniref:Uncharacterized protein n=1 Tax=Limnochorda pilosa TaxID=1555112 RepID=A0A0K2SHT3_LIMPI|nr:hypothetical protein [Limnochorda pilosa]BAS26602.1 hypothetical protein LIP_0745 [Limnochorda pilosa]
MPPTNRQRQFLERLIALYRRSREPVPYDALGRALGVSRWTAYDIARSLMRQGLAQSVYQPGSGGPGRRRVAFAPTPEALRSWPERGGRGPSRTQWTALRSTLLAQARRFQEAPTSVLRELRNQIDGLDDRLAYAAHAALFLLLAAWNQARGASTLASRLLSGMESPGVGLTAFVAALGGALVGQTDSDVEPLAEHLTRSIAALPADEVRRLVGLVRDAGREAGLSVS